MANTGSTPRKKSSTELPHAPLLLLARDNEGALRAILPPFRGGAAAALCLSASNATFRAWNKPSVDEQRDPSPKICLTSMM